MSDASRNLGIGLLVGSLFSGGAAAVLFWVSSADDWSTGPLIFACICALLTVFLIGMGIKKLAAAS